MENNTDSPFVGDYYKGLYDLSSQILVTDENNKDVPLAEGISRFKEVAVDTSERGNRIVFIGNGGSAGVASHMATDYLKNGGLRALTHSDSALLTCLSNDLGYENVFSKSLEILNDVDDLLIVISSSGESKNVLNAAELAKKKNMKVVSLSGFEQSNSLRKLGDLNFYVPSSAYGFVEITHLTICHCVLDLYLSQKNI